MPDHPMKAVISVQSYQPSWVPPSLFPRTAGEAVVWQLDQPESPHGAYWTRSASGFRRGAAVFLSSVLIAAALIPKRYFLTSKACRGILRRAERRGNELPPTLLQALKSKAGYSIDDGSTPTVGVQAIDFRNNALVGDIAPKLQAKSTGGYSLNYMPGVLVPDPNDRTVGALVSSYAKGMGYNKDDMLAIALEDDATAFNSIGFAKWKAEEIGGALTAHDAVEPHTLIVGSLGRIGRQKPIFWQSSSCIGPRVSVCGTPSQANAYRV